MSIKSVHLFIFIILFFCIASCELFYPPYFMTAFDNSANQSKGNNTNQSGSKPKDGIFVSIIGGSDLNPGTITSPMQTLPAAYSNALAGGKTNIYVQTGTFTPGNGLNPAPTGLLISNDNIHLSGGWNGDFSSQTGKSVLSANALPVTVLYLSNCQKITVENFVLTGATVSSSRAFFIDTIHDSTIMNVESINNNISGNGGGLFIQTSTNCVLNLVLSNNSGGTGGGADYYNCSLITLNGLISSNSATASGGGIYSLFGGNNTFNAEVLSNYSGADGGGIYIGSSVSNIINGAISFNSNNTGNGGGLIIDSSKNNFVNAKIENNYGFIGGGVRIRDSVASVSNTISGTIKNNSGGNMGGGLCIDGPFNNVDGAQIFGNIISSSGSGSAIYLMGGASNITIINSIISNNTSLLVSLDHVIDIGFGGSGFVFSNNLIGGDGYSACALYESSDLSNQIITGNTFLTNTMGYLYHDSGITNISNSTVSTPPTMSWNYINNSSATGAANASGNSVLP